MPDFLILVPLFVLALGAIISVAALRLSEPNRRWISIGILAFGLFGILLNYSPSSHRFDVSRWDAAAFDISLQIDGIALVLILAILLPLAALQLARPAPMLDIYTFCVLLTATLILSAGNLLTTLCAWAFLDLALLGWRWARRIPRDSAIRALILGQLGNLALFAGAILLEAKQTPIAGFMIALAFWARLGLFPFHGLYPKEDSETLELTAIRGSALVASASVWLRWGGLKANIPSETIALLASMAFAACAIRIMASTEAMEKISANAALAVIFVPLAIAFGGDAGLSLALSIALSAVFALAMFELGLIWQAGVQVRWARLFFVAGIFSIAGTPLTPAFLGRVGSGIALIENGQWLPLFFGTLAICIALAPLWQISAKLSGTRSREPSRSEYIGLQILGIAFIAFGFGATIIGQVTGEAADRALDLVIRTDDNFAVVIAFAALSGSLAISYWLARAKWGDHAQSAEIVRLAARVMDLDWLARWLTRWGDRGNLVVQSLSALAEENPTIWILFAALWIAIFVLTTR